MIKRALHPHAYTGLIGSDTIHDALDKDKDLLFLPDTAHLHMVHVDCRKIIDECRHRLASVHLKDWDPIFGRSYHRYARGFCQLGKGEVHPENVLSHLHDKRYDGWVIVECDYSRTTPEEYVRGAAEWLRKHGVRLEPGPKPVTDDLPSGLPVWIKNKPDHSPRTDCSEYSCGCLYRGLFQHLRKDSLADFGQGILTGVAELLGNVVNAQLWEYSPTNRILGLLAEYPDRLIHRDHFILDLDRNCLCRETVETRMVARIDPLNPPQDLLLLCDEILKNGDCNHIIIVPVFNSFNPNQIDLLLSLGLKKSLDNVSDARLLDYAEIIALVYETALDDLCMTAASGIELGLAQEIQFEPYLRAAVYRIRDMMQCEGVSLFLPDKADKRLLAAASTGIVWDSVPIDAQYYETDDGSLTGQVWRHNEPILLYEPRDKHIPKSQEIVPHQAQRILLIYPMRDAKGHLIGVLRCRNRAERRQMFSESDLALADAICHALVPSLQILQQSDRFRKTMDRMIHEIKMPLTAIRGANEMMTQDMKKDPVIFKYNYVEDIASWLNLQDMQINRVDHFRYQIAGRNSDLVPKPEEVHLLTDVIAPACLHIRKMLHKRGFSADNIIHDGLFNFPRIMFLDKAMFQQVFFNLLGNAIKYCFQDPTAFQVYIWTDRAVAGYFRIMFEDTGEGIAEGYEEAIFKPYVRAPKMSQVDVTGDGLGLWVVREIIQAHRGYIKVDSNKQPTRFIISLPNILQDRNWLEHRI